ncbi:uncharacterized protein LOC122647811 [Telopea speciosissima]|uniref:uncharacterized protein LOC122647811 n=1 Tax=Telopea speciosissima TaxID=54955 RepID=UPI001CC41196|nr:uncharacterized protein LOC122647811 [Telopea speciosissima]
MITLFIIRKLWTIGKIGIKILTIKINNLLREDVSFDPNLFSKLKSIKHDEVYKLSKLNLWSRRFFDQACGNTTAQSTDDATLEISLFNPAQIQRLTAKHPRLRYIHIGLIQIELTALFRQGIDTPVVIAIFDKRFLADPINALIGGIESNLIHGSVWFKLRPNFFLSVHDPNLCDSVVLKIKTQWTGMKADSHNLAVS